MITCFLSHSSKDKDNYARLVADYIGKQHCVYDEYTFEAGMPSLAEILRGLKASQLFVLLLSNSALESEWVNFEITNAKILYDAEHIKQLYPIIIDSSITYKDIRIPQWIRDDYNLKLVLQPTIAARRIRQRLRELSWQYHPRLQQRERIFVGRNDKVRDFEERMDDSDLPSPVCVIASGMKGIGRRSFLKYAFTKSNIIMESYRPPAITLNRHESIEDFILNLNP